MASKFFANENDSEHSDQEDQKSVESEKDKQVVKKTAYYESSSDEDEKRVVRSEKDKRFEALRNVISKIKDKMRIKDFVALSDEFDNLNKEFDKSKKVIEKEGLPLFYVRICYVLEQFVNSISSEEKKSLKTANNRAFNTIKQRIKKHNKTIEDKINEFAKNPVFSDEDKEGDDSDTEVKKESKKEKKITEDDDDYWENGDAQSQESEDEEEEDIKKYLQSNDPQVRRNYWLKRDKKEDEKKDKDEKKVTKPKGVKKEYDESKFEKPTKKKEAVDLNEMDKRIKDIVERRSGKKPSIKDKKFTVEEDLETLVDFHTNTAGNDVHRLEVILHLIPTRLEVSRQESQYYMPRIYWQQNLENLLEYFKIIKNNYKNLSKVRTFQKDGEPYYKENSIYESFATHFEGLDNELKQAFRAIENSSIEYSERLKDLASLIKLANDSINFYRSVGDEPHEIKFAFKKIEYTYYLSDKLFQKLKKSAQERSIDTKNEFYMDVDSQNTINDLTTKIYGSGDNKLIIKTLLYHTYNHAINGRYHVAKDLLLMSHIADMGPALDPNTQILYNRVLVQLGVCAFSLGLIQESVNALTDIVSSGGRLKELIGQGISKMSANEKEERRRLVPYHMYINTDLVEAIHLIGAMLLEIPNIVAEQFEGSKKQSTKFFRKSFELYKNFYGPPETAKDIIMVAGKALQQGNWKTCYDYLLSVNIWTKLTQDTEEAQKNLLAKVKEQAFKCYIFIFQNSYDSLDIDQLASKFVITKDYIHSFVSKMVFSKELRAYLDVDSNCLMFERDGYTRLESLSLSLSDKVTGFLQNNERIMDSKYGNYGFNDKDISEGIVKKRTVTKKKLNVVGKDKKKGKAKKN